MDDQAGPEVMWGRIADYLSGACNPEERSAVEAWAEAHPGNRKIFDQVKLIWSQSPRRPLPPADIDLGALKAKVAIGIGTRSLHPSTLPDRVRKNRGGEVFSSLPLQRWVGYFAAAVLAIVVTSTKYISSSSPTQQVKSYATAPGQRATVTLADGLTATLAPATTLEVNGTTAELTGQAVFTVTPKPGAPFVVRTGNALVKVLGTTFSVRNYPSDAATQVAVAQGRVALNTTVLSTGDMGTLESNGQLQIHREANLTSALSWADGRLVFDERPLREVVTELERWYNVRIVVADPTLLDKRIVATFNKETAFEAVQFIATALRVNASSKGMQLIIGSN